MFDTVLFRQEYARSTPPREVRRSFDYYGNKYVLKLRPVHGVTQPQLTWRTAVDRRSYLDALVSLPKLLSGNNITLIEDADVPRACDIISDFTSRLSGLPFDAATAVIGRLDVCWNWKMTEEECSARLYALRNIPLQRMTQRVTDGGTVEWLSGSHKIIAYAKRAEVYKRLREGKATEADLSAAAGMFRLEHRFMNAGACRRLAGRLGLPDRRASHLLRGCVAERVLEESMKKLGLDQPSQPINERPLLLREKYGITTKCELLLGFIHLYDQLGKGDMISHGYSEETFRRRRKDIEAAGAWSSNPTRRTLPPLRLVRPTRTQETLRSTSE